MTDRLTSSATYEPQAPLVERLRKLLPPVDQEWTEIDYLIQEAAQAIGTRSETGLKTASLAELEQANTEGYPGIAHDLETMRRALLNMLVQYDGVYDSVDNSGKAYQSQGAADAIDAAKAALKTPADRQA